MATDNTQEKDMTRLILIVTCFSIAYGQQNADFKYEENCYSVGDTITLEAVYTGSGTPSLVQWSYSGETGANLKIATANCQVFGSVPPGFPSASRINYMCQATDSLPANTYRLTVTELQSEELDDSWGATFTPPVGTAPAAEQIVITECITTSTTSTTTLASTAPTTTSTTPTSESTSTTSVSRSRTTAHIIASATYIDSTSTTSSTTKAKSETTTPSTESSSSKTVVIIVASVVGGLFVVGIVFTIILMLLSQRKKLKHVSEGIHTYRENRSNMRFQRSMFPSSLGYSNDGYTFSGKSSGHQFSLNPLIIRQSNRPVPYQYQPWTGNYRQSPYSSRYIYQKQSGDEFRREYAGQDRRVKEAPNYHY